MEWDIIITQILFAAAAAGMFVDDLSRMRKLFIFVSILTVLTGLIIYDQPHWIVIQWHCIFIFINILRMAANYLQRLDISLSNQEESLYKNVFSTLSKTEFKKIARIAIWNDLASGTRVVTQGEPIKALRVVYRGKARVIANEQFVAHIHPGGFIGEVSFLSDGIASATVVAEGPMVIVSWPSEQFRKVLDRNPMINIKTQKIFGSDLVQKIKNTDENAA